MNIKAFEEILAQPMLPEAISDPNKKLPGMVKKYSALLVLIFLLALRLLGIYGTICYLIGAASVAFMLILAVVAYVNNETRRARQKAS